MHRSNWIVGARMCEGNPNDGHTLAKATADIQLITGVIVTGVFVDKGNRGHDYNCEATIYLAGSRSQNPIRAMRRRGQRRVAVEPQIGQLKSDHRMQGGA